MVGYIYRYTNNINGKIYIGKTLRDVKTRAGSSASGYRNSKCFYEAIKQYGMDSFSLDILWEIEDDDARALNITLSIIERNEINGRLSNVPDVGYNVAAGGVGGVMTDESKKKISAKMSGRKITWANKIGDTNRMLYANKSISPPNLGKTLPMSTRLKMSEVKIGKSGYWSGRKRTGDWINPSLAKARHTRWHYNRGVVSVDCEHCDSV